MSPLVSSSIPNLSRILSFQMGFKKKEWGLIVSQEHVEFEFITEFGFITLGLIESDSCISDILREYFQKNPLKQQRGKRDKGERAQKPPLVISHIPGLLLCPYPLP